MRTRSIIGITVALVVSLQATAQEYDDMYFRSKDREKVEKAKSQSPESYSSNYENFKKKHFPEAAEQDKEMNPTDSYSARQINPEYVSRSNSEKASEEQNYFIEGYKPADTTVNSSQSYGQPYYSPGYYGQSAYNPMYSPYYGYSDPWSSPYYGGYSNSGWSTALNYYWGSYGSGWNMNVGYGMGNSCYNPYGYGYGGYGYYPGTVIIVSEASRPNYGKRPSRNSALVGDVRRHYSSNSSNNNSAINGNGSSSGRSRDEYYVRPGRRIYSNDNNSSSNTGTSNTYGTSRSRSYSNGNTNSSSSSQNRSSNLFRESRSSTYSSPSNSSFNSGGSRSRSSSSGSSGSSGGRSRGGRD